MPWNTDGSQPVESDSTIIASVTDINKLYISRDGGVNYEFAYPTLYQDGNSTSIFELASEAALSKKPLNLRSRMKIKPIAVSSVAHVLCWALDSIQTCTVESVLAKIFCKVTINLRS